MPGPMIPANEIATPCARLTPSIQPAVSNSAAASPSATEEPASWIALTMKGESRRACVPTIVLVQAQRKAEPSAAASPIPRYCRAWGRAAGMPRLDKDRYPSVHLCNDTVALLSSVYYSCIHLYHSVT